MDWGTPGIVSWYASGDDDLGNGSERLPCISLNDGENNFSDYAFNGSKEFSLDGSVGQSMSGLLGVGVRVKEVSFTEYLTHALRVTFMGGTNSPDVLKQIARKEMEGLGHHFLLGEGVGTYGVEVENLYFTAEDSIVEFGLHNVYQLSMTTSEYAST